MIPIIPEIFGTGIEEESIDTMEQITFLLSGYMNKHVLSTLSVASPIKTVKIISVVNYF